MAGMPCFASVDASSSQNTAASSNGSWPGRRLGDSLSDTEAKDANKLELCARDLLRRQETVEVLHREV